MSVCLATSQQKEMGRKNAQRIVTQMCDASRQGTIIFPMTLSPFVRNFRSVQEKKKARATIDVPRDGNPLCWLQIRKTLKKEFFSTIQLLPNLTPIVISPRIDQTQTQILAKFI